MTVLLHQARTFKWCATTAAGLPVVGVVSVQWIEDPEEDDEIWRAAWLKAMRESKKAGADNRRLLRLVAS